mmetsp:Transcript_23357/g.34963  ORF Transcript_23357/g.34963 Transcript_23357/m.34963 type:complete len:493 (-) Transcript_23357:314-1792(-)
MTERTMDLVLAEKCYLRWYFASDLVKMAKFEFVDGRFGGVRPQTRQDLNARLLATHVGDPLPLEAAKAKCGNAIKGRPGAPRSVLPPAPASRRTPANRSREAAVSSASQRAPASRLREEAVSNEGKMPRLCPNGQCRAEITDDARFCVQCGTNVSRVEELKSTIYCPKCKKMIQAGNFCATCGCDFKNPQGNFSESMHFSEISRMLSEAATVRDALRFDPSKWIKTLPKPVQTAWNLHEEDPSLKKGQVAIPQKYFLGSPSDIPVDPASATPYLIQSSSGENEVMSMSKDAALAENWRKVKGPSDFSSFVVAWTKETLSRIQHHEADPRDLLQYSTVLCQRMMAHGHAHGKRLHEVAMTGVRDHGPPLFPHIVAAIQNNSVNAPRYLPKLGNPLKRPRPGPRLSYEEKKAIRLKYRNTCRKYNDEGFCDRRSCQCAHECYICNGKHPARDHHRIQARGPQRPRGRQNDERNPRVRLSPPRDRGAGRPYQRRR